MESSLIIALATFVFLVSSTVKPVFSKAPRSFQIQFDHCLVKNDNEQSWKGRRWSYEKGNVAVYAMENNHPQKGSMEDRFSVVYDMKDDQEYVGLAIYDGHGGEAISEYAEKHILPAIIQRLQHASSTADIEEEIKAEILQQDDNVKGINENEGSTALIAVLHNNKLYIAHVGDSRAAVLFSNGEFWSSKDHKPGQREECRRIKQANGQVTKYVNDVPRLFGDLAISRALGDARLKHKGLIANADTKVIDLTETPVEYMILASDGMWDKFESKQALDFIDQYKNAELFGAKQLAEKAVEERSRDDVTVIVVKFGTSVSRDPKLTMKRILGLEQEGEGSSKKKGKSVVKCLFGLCSK